MTKTILAKKKGLDSKVAITPAQFYLFPHRAAYPPGRVHRAVPSGGLGEMTRRKREIVGLTNERDFPHLVELALPPGGFRSVFLEIDTFHRDRRIPVRRGRSRHEAEQSY